MLKLLLHRPFYFNGSLKSQGPRSVVFGLFVSVFLYFFQPFGLGNLDQLFLICIGYGIVTTASMMLICSVYAVLSRTTQTEENWTVGKELLWTTTNITLIGLANLIYSFGIGIIAWSFQNLVLFEVYTFAVGVFPASISILIRENQLRSRYQTQAHAINALPWHDSMSSAPSLKKVCIRSDQNSEQLELNQDELFFLMAADNYVEINYREGPLVKKKLIRQSLKRLEEELQEFKSLFRIHKSYLVNLDQVNHLSGNAQGYKLHLKEVDVKIPVSRQYNESVKDLLATRRAT